MDTITWTELGAFWISVALAIITVTATVINYLFFRSQIDPDVILYVTPDDNRPSFILLIIENIGKGLALDVSFSSDREIPERAFDSENAEKPKPMSRGPIITGIPALGPGAKRIITWGQFGGIKKGIGDEAVNVTIKYKGKKSVLPGDKWHEAICPIDVKSFEATDASDSNWERKSCEALEKIAKAIEKVT